MAGYGYMNRGCTDDGNKKIYGENGYFDPVSRPTIFEAEGRKRPIILHSPNPGLESYITTSTERIIEYGRLPSEPVKNYGYNNDKCRRPSSPIRDRPQRDEEFISNVQVKPNRGATRPASWAPQILTTCLIQATVLVMVSMMIIAETIALQNPL
ncbi:hypothetical protein CsSME_00023448 [Camellia sinensis var. sinensis]